MKRKIDPEMRTLKNELQNCRKRVAELEQKIPLFELIENNIFDVISIMDLELNRLYISPSVYWQRGYTAEELLAMPLSKTMDAESMKQIKERYRAEVDDLENRPLGKPLTECLELTLFRKDGSEMIAEVNAALQLDENGKPSYLVSSTRDITDRKRIENALIESESRYRMLFTDTLEALSIVKHGKIVDANRQWLRMHGYDDISEVIGKSILDFIHPQHRPLMKSRRKMQYNDEQVRIYEMIDLRKDGTPVVVEIKSNTIHFNGEAHILSAVRDITARRAVEQEAESTRQDLMKKTRELQVANRELSHYAFAVSHELKSPVRNVYSLISFLSDELQSNLTDQQKQYFSGAQNALESLRKTIDGMLEISRIANTASTMRPINIKTIIPDVFSRIQNMNGDLDLPVEWPVVLGDPVLLTQILSNLISNGFKFNRAKHPRVRISWKRLKQNQIELKVSDNGIGIDSSYFESIFVSFKRLHSRDEFEGSGIGLTIVQRAVQLMNGSIRLESIPDKGSQFFITLPEYTEKA